jgi:flagellar motility protein MotE (MotC chaperone)
MKHWGCINLIAVFLTAWGACAVQAQSSFQTEVMPSWGWKPGQVARYKDYLKPGRSRARLPWSTAVIGPAAESKQPAPEPAEAKSTAPAQTAAEIKAYCKNIEDPALDARFLYQKSELQRLEGELKKRTSELETKIAEDRRWMQMRDDFINMADASLLALIKKMKPDAAAAQLASIDEAAAAALLLKLKPRVSSAILDQMDTAKASRLLSVMIGSARRPEKGAPPETPPAPVASNEQKTPQS